MERKSISSQRRNNAPADRKVPEILEKAGAFAGSTRQLK
jgi:hypothetical protein